MGELTVDEGAEIGECPTCGIITEDDVEFNFPCPATCNRCGATLDSARIAPMTITIDSQPTGESQAHDPHPSEADNE
ncbi:hypothetical protein HUG10_21025 (plasmid) [Halorarum halophilum]|uniref:Uncharacterized protein n=1 Tax=Halorarum halophilum TaxID=2743090 RepID=A0A7D5GKU1_9EURY|nr:hypothetical protein [Halobaculum halophilum]QLG30071.1 hypothetical protein HUG10_21025 [Halobaculum halophilum]